MIRWKAIVFVLNVLHTPLRDPTEALRNLEAAVQLYATCDAIKFDLQSVSCDRHSRTESRKTVPLRLLISITNAFAFSVMYVLRVIYADRNRTIQCDFLLTKLTNMRSHVDHIYR